MERSSITKATTKGSQDASGIDWGDTDRSLSTGSFWERTMHINALELLAAKFAVLAFLKRKPPHFLIILMIRTDNSTTAACINKMGGTHFVLLNASQKAFGCGVWNDSSYIL